MDLKGNLVSLITPGSFALGKVAYWQSRLEAERARHTEEKLRGQREDLCKLCTGHCVFQGSLQGLQLALHLPVFLKIHLAILRLKLIYPVLPTLSLFGFLQPVTSIQAYRPWGSLYAQVRLKCMPYAKRFSRSPT